MVQRDDLNGLVKRLLLDAFPGMRFDVELRNPKYVRTDAYQSILVTYHDVAAQERGISQRDMRRVLEPVLMQDEFQYGSKTFHTGYLTRLAFAKKQFQVPRVNLERVQEIVAALGQAQSEESSGDAVRQAVEVLAGFLPRAHQPLFIEVAEALKQAAAE